MYKKILASVLGLVVGFVSLVGVMNKDTIPFLRVAKSDVKDRILSLVNQRKLTLERAREAVKTAEQNIIDLHRQKARLESMHSGLVGKLDEARGGERSTKKELARLQTQMVSSGVVLTSTGKSMSAGELSSTIDFQTRELRRVQAREKSLGMLLNACTGQLDRLTTACEQAPLKLRSVIAMCSDLESKTQLAVEMQSWSDQLSGDLNASGESLNGVEESLAKISADLDGEIAGLGTLMDVHAGSRYGYTGSTDDLLSKIQSALGTDGDDVALLGR